MPNIQTAYNWAIETCNKDNVGYSQQYRDQRTVNGITYYDCSSFIWYALIAGQFPCIQMAGTTWPFTTSTMEGVLKAMGFTKYSPDVTWKQGDILMKQGHTEMAFDTTRSMGAHSSKVPLAEQVSVNTNDSRNNGWYALWRYEDGAVTEWIKGNRWLGLGEMQNNATLIIDRLQREGFSINAICGILGNLGGYYSGGESTINPGIWQNLDPDPELGFGLFQWTPSTNFTNWADENGYQHDDGDAQLTWLVTQTVTQGQWIKTDDYPLSWSEFIVSEETPEYLAYAFMNNWLRPASRNQPERQQNARWWLDWYNDSYVPPENPPMTGGEWKSTMSIWMMLRRRII